MDAKGNIVSNPTAQEIEQQQLTPIPNSEVQAVLSMNRHQRRAWLARFRRLTRQAAKKEGAK